MTLKIQKSLEREQVIFTLAGRIQEEQVAQLLALLRSESPEQQIVMDLRNVKLIDREGVLFLARSEAEGTELRNCSGFIRKWINQERKMSRNGFEDSTQSAGLGE